jgi:hypothetical protein
MRVPSASIRPFACGFRFAQRTGHCDGLCGKGPMMEWEIIPLQREGNLELCTLFSCFFFFQILNHFPDITCQSVMDTEMTDLSSSLLTAIARFESPPQTGHVHLKS